MRVRIALVLAMVLWIAPARPQAWGMDVHRLLTRRALDGLPGALRPFFAAKRDFVAEHSVDPDLWRTVDLRGALGPEDPNHFLDIDALDDPPPFANVPREWSAFVARYGAERADRAGRLPWRADEVDQLLVKAFRAIPTSPYGADNARYLAGVLAHYVEDAHQPFHAVANYDGQLTNQRGIHSRFETELVRRYWPQLRLQPVTIAKVPAVKDFIFGAVISGQALVPALLDADRRATAGRDLYDDGYFAVFLRGARPVLEARLSASASAVASVIVSAWERAGKPALPPDGPRPPGRIRR